jgi:AAA+ superfamily predicted ATPase
METTHDEPIKKKYAFKFHQDKYQDKLVNQINKVITRIALKNPTYSANVQANIGHCGDDFIKQKATIILTFLEEPERIE